LRKAGADVCSGYNSAKEAAKQSGTGSPRNTARRVGKRSNADVGKHGRHRKLVEAHHQALGRLGYFWLPNAAWWTEDVPIEKMSRKQWDDMHSKST